MFLFTDEAWSHIQSEVVLEVSDPSGGQLLSDKELTDFMTRGNLLEVDEATYDLAKSEGFRAYEEDFGPIIVTAPLRTKYMYFSAVKGIL